ncbi:hypothetical protein [Pseudomonas sp.]|uniref:hypothetical protein n=1 Tax=Pseudomonas sp. TaxID=306 RepID=UPI0028ABC963|nr:hypothetical protein [Pseudomonas sp.]
MTDKSKEDSDNAEGIPNRDEKPKSTLENSERFAPPPGSPENLAPLPSAETAGSLDPTEPKRFNWLAYSFTNRLLKEYLVIGVTVWVLIQLVRALSNFITQITALFTQAVYYKSAPVIIAKTIDWHILLLGGALIVSITTVIMVMLRSVMSSSSSSQEEKKQHSTWDDMPISNFLEWAFEKLKNKFK